MKRTLVIGSSGMVASRFIDLAKNDLAIVGIDEKTLDITDSPAVKKYFDANTFDAVINFAAYTNVDGAEKERSDENGLVWRLNVEGPKNLSDNCKKHNIFFAQISTDFVFDIDGPFNEDSKVAQSLNNKIGWYGWTKNKGEVGDAIIRISYPFMAEHHDLKLDWARNLIKLYNGHKLYPLFTDQQYSILLIDDLTEPLLKIINNELTGVFHIASSDTTSPYEAGEYLLSKYTGASIELEQGSLEKFLKDNSKAPRPIYGGLNTQNTQMKLGLKFKSWKQMIDKFIVQLNASSV